MFTTTAHPGGSPRRPSPTGPVAATWVAGTGAFLLLAAAAVFIAVRWDRLPESAKLALVGALTGGFLAGGRMLRRSLPATGDVLFHLGALLLPVDLAGLGLRASVGWRALLLSEGVLGVGVLGALAAVSGSVVLTWAATASMVVLALGVAAVSPVPAAVPLAAAAVAAHLAGRRPQAVAWAAVAAFAPALGFAVGAVVDGAGAPGAGVVAALGLAGGPLALLGGLAASAVLAREAGSRHDLALAALAVGGVVTGIVTTWVDAGMSGQATTLALPVAFLAVEAVALLCERDPFWRHLARGGATLAEVVAVSVGGFWTLGLVLVAPIVETGFDFLSDVPGWDPQPAAGASLAVLAVAWLVAGLRRQPSDAPFPSSVRAALGRWTVAPWFALAAVSSVEVATASDVATAVALLGAGAVLAWTVKPLALVVAAGLCSWAPVALIDSPELALPAGAAGAAVLALSAASSEAAGRLRRRLLAAGVLVCAAAGTAIATTEVGQAVALAAFVVQAWAVAVTLDRGDETAGHVARAGMVGAVVLAFGVPVGTGVAAVALATALLAADAVRLRDPKVGVAAAGTVQVLLVLLSAAAGFDEAETGLILVLGAVVWGGLAAVVDEGWREPFLAAAGIGVAGGLLLSSTDARTLYDALVVTGGLVIAAGVVTGKDAVGHAGGVVATLGVLGHLDGADVAALEAYVAPVAAQLVVAGWRGRRTQRLSSWVAYGPAVALVGGSALAERLDGGASWHALVAGAVGVAAVAVGGWRRLAGPLFLGTGLLAAVTANESLRTLAGVPTWGWLAAGGAVLLSVGIGLERAEASPAEAGRRLVDLIAERFE